MLTAADFETNVLEFRQRSYQFARLGEVAGEAVAVFERTETESERQLRPRLIHLALLVPPSWVVLDAEADVLRVGSAPAAPGIAPVVEIAAEPSEFEEQGRRWKRATTPSGGYVYAPADRAAAQLTPESLTGLGLR